MENSIKFSIPMRSVYAFIASVFMVGLSYITLDKLIIPSYNTSITTNEPITTEMIWLIWSPVITYVCITLSVFSMASIFRKVKIHPFFPLSFNRKVQGLTDSFAVPLLAGLIGIVLGVIIFLIVGLFGSGFSIETFRFTFLGLVIGLNAMLILGIIISIPLGLLIEFSNKSEN